MLFADCGKHLKMKVFPTIILNILLVICIVSVCNGVDVGKQRSSLNNKLNINWLIYL